MKIYQNGSIKTIQQRILGEKFLRSDVKDLPVITNGLLALLLPKVAQLGLRFRFIFSHRVKQVWIAYIP